jgi:metal-dependent amidase/aminoacylase/carboxypeptidase family protein
MAIVQYQAIVSWTVAPLETAVLTVGAVQAGTDNNVIPENALLKGNLRFFNYSRVGD